VPICDFILNWVFSFIYYKLTAIWYILKINCNVCGKTRRQSSHAQFTPPPRQAVIASLRSWPLPVPAAEIPLQARDTNFFVISRLVSPLEASNPSLGIFILVKYKGEIQHRSTLSISNFLGGERKIYAGTILITVPHWLSEM